MPSAHQFTATRLAIVALAHPTAAPTAVTRSDESSSSVAVSAPARGGEA